MHVTRIRSLLAGAASTACLQRQQVDLECDRTAAAMMPATFAIFGPRLRSIGWNPALWKALHKADDSLRDAAE
jgi:hypothetical protein